MLRIRDVYPISWILIFNHPGSRISYPESNNSYKSGGGKNLLSYLFLYPQILQNLKVLIFEHVHLRKKFEPIHKEL